MTDQFLMGMVAGAVLIVIILLLIMLGVFIGSAGK